MKHAEVVKQKRPFGAVSAPFQSPGWFDKGKIDGNAPVPLHGRRVALERDEAAGGWHCLC